MNSFQKLRVKLLKYQILIFDLDDTIYPQTNFDNPALFQVAKFLQKILRHDKNAIFKDLRKLKSVRRGNSPGLIFNKYLKLKKIKNNNIINKCVRLFQNYRCIELLQSASLNKLLKELYKTKILFLVTNGNLKRQNNKIKFLKIKKYFKEIFILDGIRKETKPSIKNVKKLINFISKNRNLKATYIGDNKISDRKFAVNLKIDYIYFQFPLRKDDV